MALIQWSSSLSVGVREIDAQHQQLINMLNNLNDAMLQGKGNDAMSAIVSGLISYTRTHFNAEEKYFDQYMYPERIAHKQEHKQFVEKIVQFKENLDTGKAGMTVEVMQFLTSWLRNHIMGTDKRYTQFMNQHGIK